MTLGPLEAFTGALGEALSELSGHRFTRLTAPVAKGAATLPVESTYGWPSAGALYLEGRRYSYTGTTPTSFTGVAWPDPGLSVPGELAEVGSAVLLPTVHGDSLRFTLTGSWAGVVAFESSTDGVSWSALALTPASGPAASSAVQNGVWTGSVGTALFARARMNARTSGTVKAVLTVTSGAGTAQAHRLGAHAVDGSRTFSALDNTRGQLVVDTATGDFLSVVGRNLGVRRPPDLTQDEAFRRVVRALAYLPRGTVYGLEIALEAFFGAGNYRIVENPDLYPSTVVIELLNGTRLAVTAFGQAYQTRRERRPVTLSTREVLLSRAPTVVASVRLADEDRLDTFITAKPSTFTDVRWGGDPGAPAWAFVGDTETDVTMPGTYAALFSPSSHSTAYHRTARILPSSRAALTLTMKAVALPVTLDGRQIMLAVHDGERELAVGCMGDGDGGVIAGLLDTSSGQFLPGARVASFQPGDWVDLGVVKDGGVVQFWFNGVLRDVVAASAFNASTDNAFAWGVTGGGVMGVQSVASWASTLADDWNTAGSAATLSTAAPVTCDTHSGALVAGDVGKTFRTSSVAVPSNNGLWTVVTRPDADKVTLAGIRQQQAFVESGHPGRVSFVNLTALCWPDDVGKKVELLDGANAGEYVITAILDESGNPVTENRRAGACLVAGAPPVWTTATGLPWRLMPVFTDDTGVLWEMAGTGSLAGNTLTLRDNPPLATIPGGYAVVVEVTFSEQASGQIIPAGGVSNDHPGAWFPLYMPQHLLGPYAGYLPNLVAAGVYPDVRVA